MEAGRVKTYLENYKLKGLAWVPLRVIITPLNINQECDGLAL